MILMKMDGKQEKEKGGSSKKKEKYGPYTNSIEGYDNVMKNLAKMGLEHYMHTPKTKEINKNGPQRSTN